LQAGRRLRHRRSWKGRQPAAASRRPHDVHCGLGLNRNRDCPGTRRSTRYVVGSRELSRAESRTRMETMKMMKRLLAVAIAVAAGVVTKADGVPTVVTYVPHDKVTSTMLKGGQIVNDHGLIVLAQRRGAGEVEVHAKTNHVFIIVEGEATLVTGGTLVSPRQTAPEQTGGPS